MATVINGSVRSSIKNRKQLNDIRVCRFYVHNVATKKGIDMQIPKDVYSCMQCLDNLLSSMNEREVEELLQCIDNGYAEFILEMDLFDWIVNDEQAAFWLWGYLYQTPDSIIGFSNEMLTPSPEQNQYRSLGLSNDLHTHSARVNAVIDLFDMAIITCKNKTRKEVVKSLLAKWCSIYSKPRPVKWLPVDDEETISWVWNAIKEYQNKSGKDLGGGLTETNTGLSTWFTPLSSSEKLLAIRATFDLWKGHPDSKKLFLSNLNKAYNQRKLRQSRTDKKALNTYLKNETKERLDQLAIHYDKRISDVIEMLINNDYKQVSSSKE